MKSPFPGMDPYLERHWPDVHTKLVTYAADALNSRLPSELIARTEERVAIESSEGESDRFSPDVRVLEAVGSAIETGRPAQASSTSLAPFRLVAVVEPLTERFIEIIEATGERLVTVIEFLSPANKRGKGLEQFREKREKFVAGNVNFVEIDLVRSGDFRRLLHPHIPPRSVTSAYRVAIRAGTDPSAVYYQPISLRDPLPLVKIPLRPQDQPVELALQPLIEQAYVNGRYGRTLDYFKPPDPPLDPEDAAWAEQLLKSQSPG